MQRAILTLSIVAMLTFGLVGLTSSVNAYTSIRVNDTSHAGFGTEVRWDLSDNSRNNIANGRILYKVGAAGTTTTITGPGDEVSEIQRSFQAWASVDGLALDFEFDGLNETPTEDGNDDVNNVFWTTGSFGPGELAVTTTTFDINSGEILDADLAFNDDFVWDTISDSATEGVAGRAYIRSTGIHEIGHFVGLDHSFHGHTTLFPFSDAGAISPISLAYDDVAGLIKDHPQTSALMPNTTATVSGRVTVSGGAGVNGVMVTMVDVSTGEPVVSALSQRAHGTIADGDYRIEQVPAGNYWMFATPIDPAEMGFYYNSAFTNFVPRVRGVPSGTIGEPTIVTVSENAELGAIDFVLDSVNPFEPDNTPAEANAIAIGQATGAFISDQNDVDYFEFDAAQGEAVTIHIHADGQGSELNPFFVVSDSSDVKLLSGDFNDSTETFYMESARDIQPDAFGLEALNFDARATFMAPSTGTFRLMIDGTSFTSGFYILTLHSDRTYTTVDAATTKIEAESPSVAISGTLGLDVALRNALGEALPLNVVHTVEIVDVTGGGLNILDTANSVGPYSFSINAPAVAGTRLLQARVDGSFVNQTFHMDVYGAVDATSSIVEIRNTSMVADGVSTTPIRIGLFDNAGQHNTDSTLNVMVSTTAGSLTTGGAGGQSLAAEFNSATGLWEIDLVAPSSGTSAMVSATVGGMNIGSSVITLKALATIDGPSTGGGTGGGGSSTSSGGGGGGCALANSQSNAVWLLLVTLLAMTVRSPIRREPS